MAGLKTKLKLPPQNLEAEQSVLGSILIDQNAMIKVADMLVPKDFYNPAHGKIYSATLDLYEKHSPIDVISVTNYLKEKDTLKDIGGSGYLAELTSKIATASHVSHYASIVKEKYVLRELIRASAEITEDAFDGSDDIEQMLDGIEQKILNISQKSLPQNFTHVKDELKGAYERIERLSQGQGALRGVPTGFSELDKILSGLQKSDLIVLGARPSLGKTSLALDIARHASLKAGIPVGVFSIEMSREQVIDRIIAAESGVPLWKLRNGRISDDAEFQMIQEALDRIAKAQFFIDDTPAPNILQMRSMARRLQLEHNLGLLVVDYLQLVTPRTKSDNIVQQVTEISRGLKALARELHVPVLALSQLSREVDKRDYRVPKLSDLRESGSIEQDADVVLFLYRKQQNTGDPMATTQEDNVTQVSIAKHRNGPLGHIELRFDTDGVSFKSIEKRYQGNDEPIL